MGKPFPTPVRLAELVDASQELQARELHHRLRRRRHATLALAIAVAVLAAAAAAYLWSRQ